jgi:transcriptional regulator with XRE-family HTH domain
MSEDIFRKNVNKVLKVKKMKRRDLSKIIGRSLLEITQDVSGGTPCDSVLELYSRAFDIPGQILISQELKSVSIPKREKVGTNKHKKKKIEKNINKGQICEGALAPLPPYKYGANMRYLMKKHKVPFSDLAHKVSVSTVTVNTSVINNKPPRIDTLCRLSLLFNINVDDLLFRDIKYDGYTQFDVKNEKLKEFKNNQINIELQYIQFLRDRIVMLENIITSGNSDIAVEMGIVTEEE